MAAGGEVTWTLLFKSVYVAGTQLSWRGVLRSSLGYVSMSKGASIGVVRQKSLEKVGTNTPSSSVVESFKVPQAEELAYLRSQLVAQDEMKKLLDQAVEDYVVMFTLKGYTIADIAELVGKSVKSVRKIRKAAASQPQVD